MKLLRLLPVALLLILPFQSHAWSQIGHRIVGQIADSYLTPKAKSALREILGDTSLAIATNWADYIKSDSNYKSIDPWHYLNLPDGLSYNDLQVILANDSAINVYTKTNWLIKQLKNKKLPKDQKRFYLRLLVHFIGDISQPMHVARAEDLGANRIRLTWFGESTNLHSVWDRKLIDDQQLSYTEYAAVINHTTAAQRAKWQKTPIKDWIYESYLLSREIYKSSPPDSKLSYDYSFKWIRTVNEQLLKGGVRLAGVLNDIFK